MAINQCFDTLPNLSDLIVEKPETSQVLHLYYTCTHPKLTVFTYKSLPIMHVPLMQIERESVCQMKDHSTFLQICLHAFTSKHLVDL